jgi:hypothetical protein
MGGACPLLLYDGALEDNQLILDARIKATRGINDIFKPGTLMYVINVLGMLRRNIMKAIIFLLVDRFSPRRGGGDLPIEAGTSAPISLASTARL